MARRSKRQNPDKMTLFLLAGAGVAAYFAYQAWAGLKEGEEEESDEDAYVPPMTSGLTKAPITDWQEHQKLISSIDPKRDLLHPALREQIERPPVKKGLIKTTMPTALLDPKHNLILGGS